MLKLQVVLVPPSVSNRPANQPLNTSGIQLNGSRVLTSSPYLLNQQLGTSTPNNQQLANNSTTASISHLNLTLSEPENNLRKFLHITQKDKTLLEIAQEISQRFTKLYPDEDPLEILKLQDIQECDLDPDYVAGDVFDYDNVVRVLLSHEIKTPDRYNNISKRRASNSFSQINIPKKRILNANNSRSYNDSSIWKPADERRSTPLSNQIFPDEDDADNTTARHLSVNDSADLSLPPPDDNSQLFPDPKKVKSPNGASVAAKVDINSPVSKRITSGMLVVPEPKLREAEERTLQEQEIQEKLTQRIIPVKKGHQSESEESGEDEKPEEEVELQKSPTKQEFMHPQPKNTTVSTETSARPAISRPSSTSSQLINKENIKSVASFSSDEEEDEGPIEPEYKKEDILKIFKNGRVPAGVKKSLAAYNSAKQDKGTPAVKRSVRGAAVKANEKITISYGGTPTLTPQELESEDEESESSSEEIEQLDPTQLSPIEAITKTVLASAPLSKDGDTEMKDANEESSSGSSSEESSSDEEENSIPLSQLSKGAKATPSQVLLSKSLINTTAAKNNGQVKPALSPGEELGDDDDNEPLNDADLQSSSGKVVDSENLFKLTGRFAKATTAETSQTEEERVSSEESSSEEESGSDESSSEEEDEIVKPTLEQLLAKKPPVQEVLKLQKMEGSSSSEESEDSSSTDDEVEQEKPGLQVPGVLGLNAVQQKEENISSEESSEEESSSDEEVTETPNPTPKAKESKSGSASEQEPDDEEKENIQPSVSQSSQKQSDKKDESSEETEEVTSSEDEPEEERAEIKEDKPVCPQKKIESTKSDQPKVDSTSDQAKETPLVQVQASQPATTVQVSESRSENDRDSEDEDGDKKVVIESSQPIPITTRVVDLTPLKSSFANRAVTSAPSNPTPTPLATVKSFTAPSSDLKGFRPTLDDIRILRTDPSKQVSLGFPKVKVSYGEIDLSLPQGVSVKDVPGLEQIDKLLTDNSVSLKRKGELLTERKRIVRNAKSRFQNMQKRVRKKIVDAGLDPEEEFYPNVEIESAIPSATPVASSRSTSQKIDGAASTESLKSSPPPQSFTPKNSVLDAKIEKSRNQFEAARKILEVKKAATAAAIREAEIKKKEAMGTNSTDSTKITTPLKKPTSDLKSVAKISQAVKSELKPYPAKSPIKKVVDKSESSNSESGSDSNSGSNSGSDSDSDGDVSSEDEVPPNKKPRIVNTPKSASLPAHDLRKLIASNKNEAVTNAASSPVKPTAGQVQRNQLHGKPNSRLSLSSLSDLASRGVPDVLDSLTPSSERSQTKTSNSGSSSEEDIEDDSSDDSSDDSDDDSDEDSSSDDELKGSQKFLNAKTAKSLIGGTSKKARVSSAFKDLMKDHAKKK